MFDVGFWELILLGLVALVVLGPERLPEVARTAGQWVGRARRYASSLTQELESHSGVSDIREEINRTRDEISESGERIKSDTQDAVDDVEDAARAAQQDTLEAVSGTEDEDETAVADGYGDVDEYVDDYMRNIPDDLAEYADEEPFSVEKAREEHARRDRESEA